MRTRSPVLKDGAQSWVTTWVRPSSMRSVMRYMRSLPVAEPVLPAVLEPPTAVLPPVAALPALPGKTSILVTVLLGVPAAAPVPLAPAMAPPLLPLLPATLPLP